jgi:hypothetical protein
MRKLAISAVAAIALLSVPGGAQGDSPQGPAAGAAKAKPTRVSCSNKGGTKYILSRKPARCDIFGPNGSFGGGVALKSLKWKHWGRKTATATGIECGFKADCVNVSVKVKAYRLRKCGSKRSYTRVKTTSKFGSTTARPPRCGGSAY